LSQDDSKAWAWVRAESGFPAGADVIAGQDGVIRIPALAIALPLAEIYKDFPPPDGQACATLCFTKNRKAADRSAAFLLVVTPSRSA
jgi:hypothetical protein